MTARRQLSAKRPICEMNQGTTFPTISPAIPQSFCERLLAAGEYLKTNPDYTDPRIAAINLGDAKRIVTIPDLWRYFNLPGTPASSCLSPFRSERHPSFSIDKEGRFFYDHGVGSGGDQIDFLSLCAPVMDWWGLMDFLITMARHKVENGEVSFSSQTRSSARAKIVTKSKPNAPVLRIGTGDELAQLAVDRGLTVEGLKYASDAGVLRFLRCCGLPCWVVLDASGWCYEARRLDGKMFSETKGGLPARKAHTLLGSAKNWPVGTANIARLATDPVLVVEGGPDLLAAYDLCFRLGRFDCRPISFLGRGVRQIHAEALPAFECRHVRIVPHIDHDNGGVQAAKLWAEQLAGTGARIEIFHLDRVQHPGSGIKDLNDLVKLCGDRVEPLARLLP